MNERVIKQGLSVHGDVGMVDKEAGRIPVLRADTGNSCS